jgi:hypothetical protein
MPCSTARSRAGSMISPKPSRSAAGSGERVVIMATSTGATLATWAATQPALMRDVVGLVQISPNYGVKASGAGLLTIPWAEKLVPLIAASTRSFEPEASLHAQHWTYEYPSLRCCRWQAWSISPMMWIPARWLFRRSSSIRRWTGHPAGTGQGHGGKLGRSGRNHRGHRFDDPNNHVIAGDALSPGTTERLPRRQAGQPKLRISGFLRIPLR